VVDDEVHALRRRVEELEAEVVDAKHGTILIVAAVRHLLNYVNETFLADEEADYKEAERVADLLTSAVEATQKTRPRRLDDDAG
jgi:hypothetical protein